MSSKLLQHVATTTFQFIIHVTFLYFSIIYTTFRLEFTLMVSKHAFIYSFDCNKKRRLTKTWPATRGKDNLFSRSCFGWDFNFFNCSAVCWKSQMTHPECAAEMHEAYRCWPLPWPGRSLRPRWSWISRTQMPDEKDWNDVRWCQIMSVLKHFYHFLSISMISQLKRAKKHLVIWCDMGVDGLMPKGAAAMDVFQKQIDHLPLGCMTCLPSNGAKFDRHLPLDSIRREVLSCVIKWSFSPRRRFQAIPWLSHVIPVSSCCRHVTSPDLTVKLIGSSVRFRNSSDAGQIYNL